MGVSEATFVVNLGAIAANYMLIRKLVGDHVNVAAVVKSDAYGLGLIQVAKLLAVSGCNTYFVANIDEAARLRSSGLAGTIVVLNADLSATAKDMTAQNLTAVVNETEDLRRLMRSGRRFRYFLNIETGFSRFGIDTDKLRALRRDGAFDATMPDCIFSHLACSDNPNDRRNGEQRHRLLAACRLFPHTRRSLSASAGIWLGRAFHLDLIRVGSALYGLNNARLFPNPLISPVRICAPLVDIRHIARRQAVGYGATFRARRPTRLGIVAIGYRHGLPWACANHVAARLGEYFTPVIGRIAMEYTTIDLTDVPESALKRGSVIDFLSDDFGIDELAAAGGVSSQETLLRLGGGCRRNYTNEPPTAQPVSMVRTIRAPGTRVS